MKTIHFDGRAPSVMNVKVGNEGDNLAESIRFELPTWLDGAAPSLYLSTGKYSDVILLGADRTYRPTRTHTQHPGRWTAYLEAQQDGDVVWHSDPFSMIVGDLPDTGEQIAQAYPTAVEEAVKAAAQTLRDKDAAEAARKAAEDAADAAGNAAGIARDAAENASSAAQSAAQKVTEINDSTSRIAVEVETLAPGSEATAESSISPADGISIKLGVPRGEKGDKGDTGPVGPQGVPGADAPQIDDTQASAEHPWSGAKVAAEVGGLKDDLSDLAPAGAAVGQLFRVASISEDGKYTMEPVDMLDVRIGETSIVADGVANIPFASLNKYGLAMPRSLDYGINSTSDGRFFINPSTISDINLRKNQYKPIAPYMLDYAVKAAMCDGIGAAWTAEEQAAARERIGIPGEYELIETFTLQEDSAWERTKEPNGNDYNFTSVFIYRLYPSGGSIHGSVYSPLNFYDFSGRELFADTGRTTDSRYRRTNISILERKSGISFVKYTPTVDIGAYSDFRIRSFMGYGWNDQFGNVVKIKSYDPSGCVISIYGVRI